MAKLKKFSNEQFALLVEESSSYPELCKKLGILGGSGYRAVVNRVKSLNIDISHFVCGRGWSKGKTKETHPSIRKQSETYKATGHKTWLGRKHSLETKEKMSRSAKSWNNGLVKTKWYSVFNPALNKEVQVQGTWELAYVNWLNKKGVKWERTREKSFHWKLSEDDYNHTYYPDFYLPETDEYVEIKGYMWKTEDGRIDDSRKLRLVQEQNPDLKLIILMKEELKALGIIKK